MRNGDYTPNRFDAQIDAAQLLGEAKTQQNPENTIGAITGAGRRFVGKKKHKKKTVYLNDDHSFFSFF